MRTKSNFKTKLITISLILSPMSSAAQMKEIDETKIDFILPAGTAAPFDGVLCPERNYRLYQKCMDESQMEAIKYDSEKSKDAWKNGAIGAILGALIVSLVKK